MGIKIELRDPYEIVGMFVLVASFVFALAAITTLIYSILPLQFVISFLVGNVAIFAFAIWKFKPWRKRNMG